MDGIRIDAMTERLERLERECNGLREQARRWKRAGAMIGLGAAVFMMAGAWRDGVPKPMEVERLVIKGDDGKVYAELGVDRGQNGQRFPSLRFADPKGKTRLHIGRSELQYLDEDERARCTLSQLPDGAMNLGFHDKTGWGNLSVGSFFGGGAGIHLFGPDGRGKGGRDHGGLFVMEDGSTLLHLFKPGVLGGEDNHERVALGVGKDGTASLALRGANSKGGIRATAPPAGGSKLTVEGVPVLTEFLVPAPR